jgi:comEA protein
LKFARDTYRKIRNGLAQVYSPKELRSLLFFLAIGLLSLIYRLLHSPVKNEVSFLSDPHYLAEERSRDSLFAILARRKAVEDSFYFYAPDTTDVVRSKGKVSSKASMLAAAAISLNRASRDELIKLPSVGEATADLILEYRKERGKFRTLLEVMNVRGIGPKKFERMKPYLRLD